MVVVFATKHIIYIDSLHGNLNNNELQKLCLFIERVFERANLAKLYWDEWTFYTPKDVPLQKTKVGFSLNCGVHLCVWSHIICVSKYINFTESDMHWTRMWIMKKIIDSEGLKIIQDNYDNKKIAASKRITLPDIKKLKNCKPHR